MPDTTAPFLLFAYRVLSQDTEAVEALSVSIHRPDGTRLSEIIHTGSDAPATGCAQPPWDSSWRRVAYSLARYRGDTIQLRFELRSTDPTAQFNTWGFVDDVQVTP